MKKFSFRCLVVLAVLSVLSVSAFAAGTSTNPVYPTSTYSYITGLNSSNSVTTASATYFDAVIGSFRGLGAAIATVNTNLGTIITNTNYLSKLSTIDSDTGHLPTIDTYTQSIYSRLGNIAIDVDWFKTHWTDGSAWTSTQASNVSGSVALIEAYTKATTSNTSGCNTWLELISGKVATDATLKTRASEATVSGISSTLTSVNSSVSSIKTSVSNLEEFFVNPLHKELEDNSALNISLIKDSDALSDSQKTGTALDSVDMIQSLFESDYTSADIYDIPDQLDMSGYSFWSQSVYDDINGVGTASASSDRARRAPLSPDSPEYVPDVLGEKIADLEGLLYG